jgi:hypothetical protein
MSSVVGRVGWPPGLAGDAPVLQGKYEGRRAHYNTCEQNETQIAGEPAKSCARGQPVTRSPNHKGCGVCGAGALLMLRA